MKVVKSSNNREILLKGTTRKISSQEGGFLSFLRPLMQSGWPLMKNWLTPLAKYVLVVLKLMAATSATFAAIQKKIYGSRETLVFSNEEIEDAIKIFKSLVRMLVCW